MGMNRLIGDGENQLIPAEAPQEKRRNYQAPAKSRHINTAGKPVRKMKKKTQKSSKKNYN